MPDNLPTPCFVMDEASLIRELDAIRHAADRFWKNTKIAYSVKTNSLPYLASFLLKNGCCAEVVSQDEYDLVRSCHGATANVVCNGPIKSNTLVRIVLEGGGVLNIDSHAELESVVRYAAEHPEVDVGIGIRVNLDIESQFPQESTAGCKGGRFGFCLENGEFGSAVRALSRQSNVYVKGLHLHVSTKTRRVEIYKWLTHAFASIVREFELNRVKYLDIGGGFWGGLADKPTWDSYLQGISSSLQSEGFNSDDLSLIIEPGVSLLAGAFSYYAKVTDVKTTTRCRYVVTDGSRIHIDPFFHKTNYFYQHLKCSDTVRRQMAEQYLVGFTCLEYDNILTLCDSEEVYIGDIFRFDKVGAYTLTLSPLFISYFPPVYTRAVGGEWVCVREKWSAKELMQKSIIL